RRALVNGESSTHVRVGDFWGLVPSITGKIELVYEGEQEGPYIVALNLIGKAIRAQFANYFPEPEKAKKVGNKKLAGNTDPGTGSMYQDIVNWFNDGNTLDILNGTSGRTHKANLQKIPGLKKIVERFHGDKTEEEKLFLMEFLLHGLAEYSLLSKHFLQSGMQFTDLLSGMFSDDSFDALEQFGDPDDQ
ncbi:MAG: magnesium chelatase, partial [Chitinophagales bacterium]|nr:magnesium chelatase [Chitinophagales bacterium]